MMFHSQGRTLKHNYPTALAGQEDTHPQRMRHHTQLLGSLWKSGMFLGRFSNSYQSLKENVLLNVSSLQDLPVEREISVCNLVGGGLHQVCNL